MSDIDVLCVAPMSCGKKHWKPWGSTNPRMFRDMRDGVRVCRDARIPMRTEEIAHHPFQIAV